MYSIAKINAGTVNGLKPGQSVRDAVLKGFGVRYRKKKITYFVHTRVYGRLKWIKIGTHGSPWTPEEAHFLERMKCWPIRCTVAISRVGESSRSNASPVLVSAASMSRAN